MFQKRFFFLIFFIHPIFGAVINNYDRRDYFSKLPNDIGKKTIEHLIVSTFSDPILILDKNTTALEMQLRQVNRLLTALLFISKKFNVITSEQIKNISKILPNLHAIITQDKKITSLLVAYHLHQREYFEFHNEILKYIQWKAFSCKFAIWLDFFPPSKALFEAGMNALRFFNYEMGQVLIEYIQKNNDKKLLDQNCNFSYYKNNQVGKISLKEIPQIFIPLWLKEYIIKSDISCVIPQDYPCYSPLDCEEQEIIKSFVKKWVSSCKNWTFERFIEILTDPKALKNFLTVKRYPGNNRAQVLFFINRFLIIFNQYYYKGLNQKAVRNFVHQLANYYWDKDIT
jgi:hypothetical protein